MGSSSRGQAGASPPSAMLKGQWAKPSGRPVREGRWAKGQAIPLDFAAGMFIFMLLIVYFIIQWDIFATRFSERATRSGLEVEAISSADMLVRTGGEPANWTTSPSAVKSAGLASRQNVLDQAKISAFAALPYATAREALGTDHDFYLVIETPEGARYATAGVDGNSTRAAEVTRVAVLGGTMVHVKLRLYE